MQKKLIVFLLGCALLCACAPPTPSPAMIQTAIAQTQANQPQTNTPEPSATAETTPPPTPTPTETSIPATATLIPTPTNDPAYDLYTGSPKDLLCEKVDLPANYYLFGDNSDPLAGQQTNEMVVADHPDAEKAQRYLDETGRLVGWWKTYALDQKGSTAPETVYCQTTVFQSTAGAQLSLLWPLWDDELNFYYVDVEETIGDTTVIKYRDVEVEGDTKRLYRVQFTYHNLVGIVRTSQPAEAAMPDFAILIAKNLLERYQAAEFVYTPPETQN
jgi:hypothetical protein